MCDAECKDLKKYKHFFSTLIPKEGKFSARDINQLLKQDFTLQQKLLNIEIFKFIERNSRTKEDLEKSLHALKYFTQYTENLLLPIGKRPQGWDNIMFENEVFQDKIDCLKGSREILIKIGYRIIEEDRLKLSDGQYIDQYLLSVLMTDLTISIIEITFFLKNQHPKPESLTACNIGIFKHHESDIENENCLNLEENSEILEKIKVIQLQSQKNAGIIFHTKNSDSV